MAFGVLGKDWESSYAQQHERHEKRKGKYHKYSILHQHLAARL